MESRTGRLEVTYRWDGKHYYLKVAFIDEQIRAWNPWVRFTFTGSNGWRLISGTDYPPMPNMEYKWLCVAGWQRTYDEQEVKLEGPSIRVYNVIKEIMETVDEANQGLWEFIELNHA